jgi:integrase
MDKDKFHQLIQIKYSNLRTRREFHNLALRIEKYWEADQFTQASLNRFQAELTAKCKMGRLGSLPMTFMKLYVDCYSTDVMDMGLHPIKITKPSSRQFVRLQGYKFLNREELNLLLHSIKDPYLKVTTRLMAETGLRISELLAIKGTDINLTACTIHGIGKGNKEFLVHFGPTMRDLIIKWIGVAPFPEREGRPFAMFWKHVPILIAESAQRTAYWRLLNNHLKMIGYPRHVHPHMLKHTFARLCRDKAGMDLQEIMVACRHASITSTIRYAPATTEEVAKKVEKVWGKNKSTEE